MDGKELEIKRRFKAGDRVVFRLGERENQTCPHCSAAFYNSEAEQRLVALSGCTLRVEGSEAEFFSLRICAECGREARPLGSSYILRDVHTFSSGQRVTGFGAYEAELTTPTEADEEDERGND